MERIGYIGVGTMGRPMVMNLLKAGFAVTIGARSPEKVADVVAAGATLAPDFASVGRESDIVFLCVSNGPDVIDVVTGPGGVLEGIAPGGIIVDNSTIDPEISRQVAAVCEAKGVGFLDAPISGGETGAINCTLTVMVGGDAALVERARPAFNAIGNPNNIVHCGPVGAGETVKLVNNLLGATIAAATGEALLLGVKAGIDLNLVHRALSTASGASTQLNGFPDKIYNGQFKPGFMLDLMTKDVLLATALAEQIGHQMPFGTQTKTAYLKAQSQGLGTADHMSVVQPMEQQAGVTLRS